MAARKLILLTPHTDQQLLYAILANVICMISWGSAFARIGNMQDTIVYLIICSYLSCKVVTLEKKNPLESRLETHSHCSIVASPSTPTFSSTEAIPT